MLILFAAFLVWMHAREALHEKLPLFLPYTFAADIILLILLDDSSKFVVNYYFNIYYFFSLIAAGLMLQQRQRLLVGFCIIVAALVKYYRFEERNRIAREIHDSVGHNLTGLIMNLEFCEKLMDIDTVKVKTQVQACKEIARVCLTEIRRSVQALKPQSVEQLPLIKSIEEVIENSRRVFDLDIRLTVEGSIYKTTPDFNIVIYRAVQEAVTNSVRHGKATRIDIAISYSRRGFSLFIKDNGTGTGKFKMGNGLKGMTERIKEFNGESGFYKNDGFMINISVPVEGIVNEQDKSDDSRRPAYSERRVEDDNVSER